MMKIVPCSPRLLPRLTLYGANPAKSYYQMQIDLLPEKHATEAGTVWPFNQASQPGDGQSHFLKFESGNGLKHITNARQWKFIIPSTVIGMLRVTLRSMASLGRQRPLALLDRMPGGK
jgi:hypothetical protein